MPYVRRNADGQIDSLHRARHRSRRVPARRPPRGPGLRRATTPVAREDFSRLDADFVRVLEDVIDTLIVKNILNITDLPEQAQAKLFARKSFRERVSKSSLRLFEPTDFGDVI